MYVGLNVATKMMSKQHQNADSLGYLKKMKVFISSSSLSKCAKSSGSRSINKVKSLSSGSTSFSRSSDILLGLVEKFYMTLVTS